MQINYSLSGSIYVPEGSKINETATAIILPDGQMIKLWEAIELADSDDENHRTLTFDETTAMDIHYDGDMARFEVVA